MDMLSRDLAVLIVMADSSPACAARRHIQLLPFLEKKLYQKLKGLSIYVNLQKDPSLYISPLFSHCICTFRLCEVCRDIDFGTWSGDGKQGKTYSAG